MSIVALKRKGQILHTLSGKSPKSTLVNRGPDQDYPFSSGGGFTLHGKQRNIGYIGRNSLNSIGGTKMKPGTRDWKGNGGCCGGYNINPSPNNQCCVVDIGVKPSVLNTKGMLARKYRWKKSDIPDDEFTNQGFEVPAQNQLQSTYNRWVANNSSSYNMKHTSQQYTENLAATVAFKNPPKEDSNVKSCHNQCYHIGGRFVAPRTYCKFLNHAGSSSRAREGAIAKRASLFPKGYNQSYPPTTSVDQCQTNYVQPNDPRILQTYYYDENNTSMYPC